MGQMDQLFFSFFEEEVRPQCCHDRIGVSLKMIMWMWSLMSVHDLVLPCFPLTRSLISVDDDDMDVWPKKKIFSLHEENAKLHIDWSSSFTRPALLLQRR